MRLVLTALLLAVAACGGGPHEKTFRRGGLSFTYPHEWRQITSPAPAGTLVGDYQVRVGPEGSPQDLVSVTFADVGIRIRGQDLVVTERNIDEQKGLLSTAVGVMVGLREGNHGEPIAVAVGGLSALRFEASNLKAAAGHRVEAQITDVFKRSKSFIISCEYTHEDAAEVKKACDLVLRSFRVS